MKKTSRTIILPDPDEWVSETTVAQITNTSIRTWQGYRYRGDGPRYSKISGRCIRYQWKDVLRFLRERQSE